MSVVLSLRLASLRRRHVLLRSLLYTQCPFTSSVVPVRIIFPLRHLVSEHLRGHLQASFSFTGRLAGLLQRANQQTRMPIFVPGMKKLPSAKPSLPSYQSRVDAFNRIAARYPFDAMQKRLQAPAGQLVTPVCEQTPAIAVGCVLFASAKRDWGLYVTALNEDLGGIFSLLQFWLMCSAGLCVCSCCCVGLSLCFRSASSASLCVS